MRSGELPRLSPPRVESWRACRGGLEVAGKDGGVYYKYISMVLHDIAGRIRLFTERRRDKPSSRCLLSNKNATKRAALQLVKL